MYTIIRTIWIKSGYTTVINVFGLVPIHVDDDVSVYLENM